MNRTFLFLAIQFVFLFILPSGLYSELAQVPIGSSTFWLNCGERIEAFLGEIGPNLKSLHLQFKLTAGQTILGTGTLCLEKDRFHVLELFSRNDSLLFRHSKGTTYCYLSTGNKTVLFKTGSEAQVPIPIIKIDKDSESFHFDFQLNLTSNVASDPLQIWVHPETSRYIVKRMQEIYPKYSSQKDHDIFSSPLSASLSVSLFYSENKINAFEAFFSREGKPPIGLKISKIIVNQKVSEPQAPQLFKEANIPWGKLDSIYSFTKGFYSLLSDFFPRAGE